MTSWVVCILVDGGPRDWAGALGPGVRTVSEGAAVTRVLGQQRIDAVCLLADAVDDAVPVVRLVAETRPDVAVVVAARRECASGPAVAAGARTVVSGPSATRELGRRVDEARAWTRDLRRRLADTRRVDAGRVVAFLGSKGGVGTTTLVAQVGAALRRTGKASVCVVDLDSVTADLAERCGVRPTHGVSDLLRLESDLSPADLDSALVAARNGAYVLGPGTGELPVGRTCDRVGIMLRRLAERFGTVVVDCGALGAARASGVTRSALRWCDARVVVVTPDVPSIRAAQRWLGASPFAADRSSHPGTCAVLNRWRGGSGLGIAEAGRALPVPVAPTAIPAAFESLMSATNAGSPDAAGRVVRRALAALAVDLGIAPGSQPRDKGFVAVETVAMLPLALLVTLLLWQTVLWGLTSMLAEAAAREAAIAAATGASPLEAAESMLPEPWERGVSAAADGQGVMVELEVPLSLPDGSGRPWRTRAFAEVSTAVVGGVEP